MKNRTPLFGLLAVVLLSVGFYFLIWSPKSEAQAAFETETAQLDQQIATLENEVDRLLEIQANEDDYRAKLELLSAYIPEDDEQPIALQQLQETADLSGVTITGLTYGEPVLVEGAPPAENPELALAKIDVAVTAEGGYFQHVDLLRRMEVDTPRAFLVRSVSLSEGDDGFPELMATWTGEIFTVVPVEPGTTPTQTGDAAAAGAEGAAAGTGDAAAPTDGSTPAATTPTEPTS